MPGFYFYRKITNKKAKRYLYPTHQHVCVCVKFSLIPLDLISFHNMEERDLLNESVALFFLEEFKTFINLDAVKSLDLALSPMNAKLAVATETHLIITDDRDLPSSLLENPVPAINTLLEFSDETGKCTALRWLTEDVICVGFESGDFACFEADGRGVMEQRCDNSPVRSMRISQTLLPGTGDDNIASSLAYDQSLWILYQSGVLAVVPIGEVLQGRVDSLIRFQLLNTTHSCDFVLLPVGGKGQVAIPSIL